jgi:replication factor C subunit 2/4
MASFFDNKARAAAAASASSSKAKPTTDVAPRMQPWVEKYRPRTLDEVKSQEHATETLRRMVNSSNLPHLLLYGPPGTGKTSTILALSRELFGPELFSNRVLELNASDERGLSVVRERVKNFAQQALIHAPASKEYRDKYPCPPFKIIILDEADSLTQDAQSALRRTMEIYSKLTRFCLCCNYVSRIIDPVASRCSKFRFKSLDGEHAHDRIAHILETEGVSYEPRVIEKALTVSDGDLRRAINLLQSAARLVGATSGATNGHAPKKSRKNVIEDDDEEMADAGTEEGHCKSTPIKVSDIDEISGIFPPELAEKLVSILHKGNTSNYDAVASEISDIAASGYSANEVLLALYNKIIYDDMVDSRKKYKMTLLFSEMDKRLIDGVDEHLTMLDMCLQIAGLLVEK